MNGRVNEKHQLAKNKWIFFLNAIKSIFVQFNAWMLGDAEIAHLYGQM